MFSGGLAFTSAAAYATPNATTVEFSGGSGVTAAAVSCRSEPNQSRLSVEPGGQVVFVNHLGRDAVLYVGRTAKSAPIRPGEQVSAWFRSGSAQVTMRTSCSPGTAEDFRPVFVNVTGKPATDAQLAADKAAASARPSPSRTAVKKSASAQRSSAAAAGTQAVGPVDSAAGTDADSSPWAPAEGLPAAAQGQPVPRLGDGVEATADVGEPVAVSGTQMQGPSGLLAMIAMVLTIGVGVAAVRTLVGARAHRGTPA
jgi:cobalamin biosynthesis Mg chelatase CobN